MSKRKSIIEWQIESDLIHNKEFQILQEPKSGQDNVEILHKLCGNIIFMKLNNHLKRYCKYCSRKNKKTLKEWQELSDKIHNSQFKILEEPKNGKSKVRILHKKCTRVLIMTMNNHINHRNGCKDCSKYSHKPHQYWVDKCVEIWKDDYVWKKVKVKHNRDNIKNKYFKQKGITLIRITNQELFKINDIINEHCNKEKN